MTTLDEEPRPEPPEPPERQEPPERSLGEAPLDATARARRPLMGQFGVLLVVALVLIAILLSTGRRPVPAAPPSLMPPRTVSGDEVAQLQREIAAQERLLAETQARLQRNFEESSAPASDDDTSAPAPVRDDPIARQQEELEYRSLFADNVAFTARADRGAGRAPTVRAPAADDEDPTGAALRRTLAAVASQAEAVAVASRAVDRPAPAAAAASPVSETPQPSTSVPADVAPERTPPLPRVARAYPLLEGHVIETVLTNRLEGEFAGPVNVMVTTPVYSQDTVHLLVPAGSRLLGEAARVTQGFQARLAVRFHRLIFPDGRTVSLESFLGLDQVGATGLKDRVNQHVWAAIGAAGAVGLVQGLGTYAFGYGYGQGSGDRTVIISQSGAGASEAMTRVLDRYTNRLPTVTIREGTRVRVLVTRDLTLPAYVHGGTDLYPAVER